jgi:hypothetical protein
MALLAIGAGAFIAQSTPAQSATLTKTPPFTVTVTPTQDLLTGQKMTVTVNRTAGGTAAGLEIHQLAVSWCAPGTTIRHVTYNALATVGGSNALEIRHFAPTVLCSSSTHPLNGNPQLFTQLAPAVKPTGTYSSYSATVQAQSTLGVTVRGTSKTTAFGHIACNVNSPCTMLVSVDALVTSAKATPGNTTVSGTYFFMTPVTYAAPTAVVACGGVATGELSSAGPDRMTGLLTTWAEGACRAGLGGGKLVATALTTKQSDDTALCGFASGKYDLAYSAIGYGTTSSPFNPANCTALTGGPQPDRPYVAVPVGLNAVVLAHTQTQNQPLVIGAGFQPYQQLDITDAQLAQLLGEGGHTESWTDSLGQQLISENPTLVRDFYYEPGTKTSHPIIFSNPVGNVKGAVVTFGAQATTYLTTSLLHNLVPSTLVSVTKAHTVMPSTANFSLPSPAYDTQSITGLINIVHAILPTHGSSNGGVPWALLPASDADSIWFGLDDFALQTPDSVDKTPAYVAPTKAAMQAAAADMISQPDGTAIPDPQAAAVNGQEPYPLTYVEYAIVPTQPLMTSTCTPRTQSQQNLMDWLNYITGPGQTLLPSGMASLTPALETQARTAIAKVGQAAPACTVKVNVTGKVTTTGTSKATSGATSSGGSNSATPAAGTTAAGGSAGSAGSAGTRGTTGGSGASRSGRGSSSGKKTGSGTTTATSGTGSGTGSKSKHKVPSSATDLAAFQVAEGPSWLWPVGGLLLLFVLLPSLVLVASGRSPRQALAGLGRRLRSGTGQPPGGSEPPGPGGPS